MHDPRRLAGKLASIVYHPETNERKYYRFRHAPYYGGIATADAVGCNLACAFCWVRKPRTAPAEVGRLYSPEDVADRILAICRNKGISRARISGAEPTIGFPHLVAVLEALNGTGIAFILETNGTLIGHEEAHLLAPYRSYIHVRVSLKADTPARFSALTGCHPEHYALPFAALGHLMEADVPCHAALVENVCSPNGLAAVERRLLDIHPRLATTLELERLIMYPFVRAAMASPKIRQALDIPVQDELE